MAYYTNYLFEVKFTPIIPPIIPVAVPTASIIKEFPDSENPVMLMLDAK